MPVKKRAHIKWMGRSPGQIKDIVIILLLIIVFMETALLVRIYAPKRLSPKVTTPVVHKPRIAIIVDDNGYNANDCRFLQGIDQPVTISVLPELKFSATTATCARQDGKEVMLHLPMEPHDNRQKYPEHYIIKTSMPAEEVVAMIDRALSSVPYVSGINNHMGSKATENARLMSVLFTQMKKHNLFFVDSRVTAKTICRYLAKERNLPFSERDVFLDNQNDRDYIEGQFRQLAQIARKKGYAIGIGHARPLTWEIIKEQLGALSAAGFEVVTVKNIINSL